MSTNQRTLMFVYNADSGLLNLLKDALHKSFSPATYPCSLCDITYSPVRMRKQWKQFVESLPYNVEFSYKDLVADKYELTGLSFPNAWIVENGSLTPWLSAQQIDNCKNLEELIELVKTTLPQ